MVEGVHFFCTVSEPAVYPQMPVASKKHFFVCISFPDAENFLDDQEDEDEPEFITAVKRFATRQFVFSGPHFVPGNFTAENCAVDLILRQLRFPGSGSFCNQITNPQPKTNSSSSTFCKTTPEELIFSLERLVTILVENFPVL